MKKTTIIDILINIREQQYPHHIAEVRECPHCQGEARLILSSNGNHVTCLKCGASGPHRTNPVDAVNSWNCRKDDGEYVMKLTSEDVKLLTEHIRSQAAADIQASLEILDKIYFKSGAYIPKDGVVRILSGFRRNYAKL